MCKRIEELVADQFRNFTGVVVKDENQLLNLEVFPQKREPFKQLLRNVLPDLRLRSSYGLVTVADFARLCGERGRQAYGFLSERLGNCPTDDRKQCFDP